MHPILARGARLALYLALWIAIGALLAVLLAVQIGLRWPQAVLLALPIATLYAFVCLSAWYVSGGMPLVGTGAVQIVATALTASSIASAMWVFAARLWADWLSRRGIIPPLQHAAGAYALVSALGLLLYLLALSISYLASVFERTRAAERRELQVQVLAREAELRMLRAQIDPHFLFNCLHSISALTASNAAAARQMCLLLADFLRESLALGLEDRITLAREVALVSRFLAVERVRFGGRLRDAIEITDEARACLVPPLLLQPLVENAVTHGVAHVLDGGTVTVTALRLAGRLQVVVENPCDPDRPRRTGSGVGLANVQARLTALHGSDARFSAGESDGIWRVELTMPGESAGGEPEPAS
jgi:two-component system sensor histidine kinase AlgZ